MGTAVSPPQLGLGHWSEYRPARRIKLIMEILLALVGIGGALALLGWLGSGTSNKPPDPNDPRDVGFMAGMMGGEIEDAFLGKHALDRAAAERKRRGEE